MKTMQQTQINPDIILDSILLSKQALEAFQNIRSTENKHDSNRRGDLYGPYEIVWLDRSGTLPSEYFENNDQEPWKLLPDEARRNILWQALSGCLDINQEWALIYIQLVMDKSLSTDEFSRDLAKVNKQFLHSLDHRHHNHNHNNHHHAMQHKVGHIDCPGCSATAALLMIDPDIRTEFEREILPLTKLSPEGRLELLRSQKLDAFLNKTIQDESDGIISLS